MSVLPRLVLAAIRLSLVGAGVGGGVAPWDVVVGAGSGAGGPSEVWTLCDASFWTLLAAVGCAQCSLQFMTGEGARGAG